MQHDRAALDIAYRRDDAAAGALSALVERRLTTMSASGSLTPDQINTVLLNCTVSLFPRASGDGIRRHWRRDLLGLFDVWRRIHRLQKLAASLRQRSRMQKRERVDSLLAWRASATTNPPCITPSGSWRRGLHASCREYAVLRKIFSLPPRSTKLWHRIAGSPLLPRWMRFSARRR